MFGGKWSRKHGDDGKPPTKLQALALTGIEAAEQALVTGNNKQAMPGVSQAADAVEKLEKYGLKMTDRENK
jgi:hypothetical protein